jgi:hypothetical protein
LTKKRNSDSSASYSLSSESGSIEENDMKKKVKTLKNKSGRMDSKTKKRPPMEKKKPSAAKKYVPKVLTKKHACNLSSSYLLSLESGSIEENGAKNKVKIPKNKSGRMDSKTKTSPPMEQKNPSAGMNIVCKVLRKNCNNNLISSDFFLLESGSMEENDAKEKISVHNIKNSKNKSGRMDSKTRKSPPMKQKNPSADTKIIPNFCDKTKNKLSKVDII